MAAHEALGGAAPCRVCRSHDYSTYATRTDGVPVLVCETCGLGCAPGAGGALPPERLDGFWVGPLAELLAPGGRRADLVDRDEGPVEVLTAAAAITASEDPVARLEEALRRLTPDGVAVVVTPALTPLHDDSAWFSEHPEHRWYATEAGLDALVGHVHRRAAATLLAPVDGPPSLLALVSADGSRDRELESLLTRLTTRHPPALPDHEARARALLMLLHLGHDHPDDVALLRRLHHGDWSGEVADRLATVWTRTARELQSARRDVADAHDHVSEAERQLADGEQQLEDRRAELDAVYASTSWRLTAPVRAVGEVRRLAREGEGPFRLVDRRRVRTAVAMIRRGELGLVLQRTRALLGHTVGPTAPRGPLVERARDPWPVDAPLVTVVIPCFNYGAYVEEAVRSALAQTLERIEVIVVDGGSDDGTTPQVLTALEAGLGDARLRVVRRDGRHLVGDNRNHGIELARGRYVCCLDADDVLDPTYLALAVFRLEREGYDVVSTAIRVFGREERVVGILDRPHLGDMLDGNHVTTVGVFRRSDWERAGGYRDTGLGRQHVHEDWRFFQRVVALGARVGNLSGQPLFGYRSHSTISLSSDPDNPDLLRQRQLIREHNADVITEDALARSKELRETRVRVTGSWRDLAPADGRPTVLLLVPFLLLGGAERMQARAVAALVREGFRVVVVTTEAADARHGDTTEWFTASTPEVLHLPRLVPEPVWTDFVDHVVETRGVDLVWLAGSRAGYRMLPGLRARNPRLRVVDLLYNTEGHVDDNRRFKDAIDVVACEGPAVRDWLLAHGETPDRVVAIPNGVDLTRHTPRDRPPARSHQRVGFVGRLSEEKDPYAFLDLAAACADLPARFELAGVGPLESRVRARVRALELRDRVVVHGAVDDVPAFLRDLDLLVLPSRLDGRPNAVLEALASGVPVVASRVGELPDMVDDGLTGWLYPPGDPAALAAAVRGALTDPERRASAAAAARRAAEERFDAEQANQAYVALFRRLIEQGRAAG